MGIDQNCAHIIAIVIICASLGSKSTASDKMVGYTGPYNKPIMAVEKAFSNTELINQMVKCIDRALTKLAKISD